MPNFETEAKKKLESQLQEMEKHNIENGKAEYIEYVKKLKALNKLTKEQYKKDRHGLYKALTPDKLTEIKQLYSECGTQGEKVLKELEAFKGNPGYDVLENVHNMLAKDMQIINAVNEKSLASGTASFQKLIDAARSRTVDISGRNLGTVGAQSSSRIPFNFVESDGHEMPGVFTPKAFFSLEKKYNEMEKEIEKISPEFAQLLARYNQAYFDAIKKDLIANGENPDKYTRGEMLYRSMAELESPKSGMTKVTVANTIAHFLPAEKQALKNLVHTQAGNDAIVALSQKAYMYVHGGNGVNYQGAEMADLSRTDSRNSAMSCVADLLNVPNLICKAEPMNIIQDGKTVEATFMGMAEGVDIFHPPLICGEDAYKSNGPVFKNTNGLKDIADIQILDFICGNVDRHCGNMFYKFDTSNIDPADHKFTGIQGIDNDSSFGTYVPKDRDEDSCRLPSLNNMKVISSSMANRVMSLNSSMLAFALRNHDLSEAQLSAAKDRLKMLQDFIVESMGKYNEPKNQRRIGKDPNAIIPGTIKIIKDDDFCNLDLSRLRGRNNQLNTFDVLEAFNSEVKKSIKKNASAVKNPEKIEEQKLFAIDDKEMKWANDMVTDLANATSKLRTSDQYIAVQQAAENYKAFCETNKGSVLSEDLYEVRNSYLNKLQKTAKAYCDYKKDVKNPKSYTKRRIDLITSIEQKAGIKAKEDFYGNATKNMDDNAKQRYADGLHEYADRSLEDFNARMRKMAEELAKKHSAPEKKQEEPQVQIQ